ncbi:MAG: histidine phosphatase family protein [Erysipelotrichaceae bacterium]|nr:histidine phosphatase family protein [Erysipelotrichaceae bacterium]
MNIYIMRHGKTVLNSLNLVQGSSDSPLNDEGILQAHLAGQSLRDLDFQMAFAGNLKRQIQTAEIVISENNSSEKPQVIIDKGFDEMHFGSLEANWTNMKMDGLAKEYAEKYHGIPLGEHIPSKILIRCMEMTDPLHQMETYEEVADRSLAAFLRARKEAERLNKDNVLIVTSGITIRVLAPLLDPSFDKSYVLGNCGIIKADCQDDGIRLEIFDY